MYRLREKPWLYPLVIILLVLVAALVYADVMQCRITGGGRTSDIKCNSAGELFLGAASQGTLDADDTAACLAIPSTETDYTLTHDMTTICTSGNTAYIDCDDAAPVTADHTVGNFSIVVPEGTCFGPYDFGDDVVCSYIGISAAGVICFNGSDY